jgi:UDP:flavonoid glycosyltransferase YjiC (YdhE family)
MMLGEKDHGAPLAGRVLCFVDANWLGHCLRLIEVARCLEKQGAEVEVAGRGRFADLISAQGFPFHRLPGAGVFRARRCGRVGLSWLHECRKLGERVRCEVELLAARRPDVVVFDYCPTANLSAEIAGVPSVSLLNANYTSHVELERVPLLPAMLDPFIRSVDKRRLVNAAARLMVLPLNVVRRCWGLAPWPDFFAALAGHLNLVCDNASFAGAADLPDPHKVIGPILVRPASVQPIAAQLIDDRPVFVTLGSNSYPWLMEELLKSLAKTGLPTVVSVSGGQARELSVQHPWARVYGLLDNLEVMPLARCVICHGGAGTVYQAIATGVPVIAVPLNHGQQYYAERLDSLGLGRGLPTRLIHSGLEPAITELCSDDALRRRLRHEGTKVKAAVGANGAAALVLELIDRRRGQVNTREHREDRVAIMERELTLEAT